MIIWHHLTACLPPPPPPTPPRSPVMCDAMGCDVLNVANRCPRTAGTLWNASHRPVTIQLTCVIAWAPTVPLCGEFKMDARDVSRRCLQALTQAFTLNQPLSLSHYLWLTYTHTHTHTHTLMVNHQRSWEVKWAVLLPTEHAAQQSNGSF